MFRIVAKRISVKLALALALWSSSFSSGFCQGDISAALVMIRLSSPGPVTARGQILDKATLQNFYAGRGYNLAWDASGVGLGWRAAEIVSTLAAADAEGLEPSDYHIGAIRELAAATEESDKIDRDLLISDGLSRYARDMTVGRLSPAQTDERAEAAKAFDQLDCLEFAASLEPASLADFLAAFAPSTPEYKALKRLLAQLRLVADAGGWSPLMDGGTVHPGQHDPGVPSLRRRMIAEGRLSPSAGKLDSDLYDRPLAAAVAEFQRQHGLKPDGALGKDTRAALDTPVETRIHQAVVNLERLRWPPALTNGRRVEVNLAAYSLNVFQDGESVLAMPVVVGTPENPTPVLDSRIVAVVLNPNWTLPPAVIKEILPKIKQNANYLASHGIAREQEDGKVRLVQPPGPTNPLGHYKFVIPNNQDIYLHDSPDAAKFRYENRTYSHGCVRLGNPAALAALLLEDQLNRLPDGLDVMVQTGSTRHIALQKPVPVSLIYRTAWLDADGDLVLGQDGYGRDQLLWAKMHKLRQFAAKRVVEHVGDAGTL
jgi:murein L,D-transpeptidase YcbB/YkuD